MLIGDDVNAMQRLLTRLIAKKINAATSHIRRIIMSEDTSENLAEIYGRDGRIYYRRMGSSGKELCTGGWKLTIDTRWSASTAVTLTDYIGPNVGGANRSYECTTAGTTGATEPTWTTTVGNTNTDGTAIWTCRSVRLIPNEDTSVTDIDVWARPQGSNGVVYLG